MPEHLDHSTGAIRAGHSPSRSATLACACLVLAWLCAACDHPEQTRGSSPSLPTAPTTPGITLVALTIAPVDAVILIGQPLQLRASAQYSDGSEREVTNDATWASSDEAIARVVAGLLTVTGVGEADISARLQDVVGSRRIVGGRPSSTVSGVVHETFATDLLVDAARVEVVGGAQNGRVVTTDARGRFELPGVTEPGFALKIKKSGYDDAQYNVVSLPRDANADIALRPFPVGPEPVARLAVNIDSDGSTAGLIGFTPIRFDATASSADRPTYVLDFGDGHSTSQPVATHVCERLQGPIYAVATVTDRFGRRASATQWYSCLSLVHAQGEIYSLTYGWVSHDARGLAYRKLGFRTQTGAVFSGFYTGPENTERKPFTGRLTGQNSIAISLDDGSITFEGRVLLQDQVVGVGYYVNRKLLLNVRGGAANGMTLTFDFYDPF
jgi:hypothetical protein